MPESSTVPDEKKDDSSLSGDPNAKPMDDASSTSSHETLLESHPKTKNKKPIAKKKRRKNSFSQPLVLSILRFVFLDLIVLAPLAVFVSMQVIEKVKDNFLLKQMKLQVWNDDRRLTEITYFHRECEEESLTAHDTPDLLIDPAAGTKAAVEKMMIHGASVYPNLLNPETAKELRDWMITENKRTTDIIPVIENKNRWSFPIQVDQHPLVAKALKEILSKDYLVNALEGIMGPNPAVIEFTGITSAYGAKIQRMHQDVIPESSAAKFNRNYIPSYSLFIPLQNTTQEMGATEVCPGTHQLSEGCNDLCERDAFHVSGSQNNWPMGFGALVNQQTTHRGPAHTGRGQPERVLFILTFAPRPRFEDKQIETRMLGSGGSYSMHWSQWGHTLRDYADPERRMSYFWRHLKSLGIYKPWGHDWGWDYVTVASQRMVGEELGFAADDLADVYKKGKFDWMPKSLHGSVLDTDDSVLAWTTFLGETVSNIKDFAQTWYITFLFTYLTVIIGGNLLLHAAGFISNAHVRTVQCVGRVTLTHGGVVLFAYLYYQSVARGSWARNIREGYAFRGPNHNFNPNLPGTLPNKFDVLVFDELQSPWLASTAFVYDYTHPGSYKWMNMTRAYGNGFDSLTSALQSQLCEDLIEWQLSEHQSRILVKNREFEWAVASDDLAKRICRKNLIGRSNEFKSYAVKWIDFLISELRYGFWRESAMHQVHMQPWLSKLQDKLLGFQRPAGNKTDLIADQVADRSLSAFVVESLGVPQIREALKLPSRSVFPPRTEPEEPWEGAWLQEGDIVEAHYNSFSGEFYRARILTPICDTTTWEVEYDDGEVDGELCPTCLRPFVSYEVGEETEWTDKESDFVPCMITAVTGEDSYDVELDDGRQLSNVSAANLRRTLSGIPRSASKGEPLLQVGARVRAEFPGENSGVFYPGTITAINGALFSIQYDDGDFSDRVTKGMITG